MNGGDGSAGLARSLTAAWALSGVTFLFGGAVLRLGRRGLATVEGGLEPAHLAVLVLLVGLFVYGEGIRAIQRKYAPFLLDRVARVSRHGRWFWRVLAPLYAMSLVGAPPSRLLRAWGGVAAIVCAILLLRVTPEPWRGMVDCAVALALAWGLASILTKAFLRGLGGRAAS